MDDLQTAYLEMKIAQLMAGRPGTPAEHLDAIIHQQGLTIEWADLGPTRFGALDLWEAKILVNTRLDSMCGPQANVWGMRTMTCGHELGHFFQHRPELMEGVEMTERHEEEAWAFANCLLLPRDMLREDPSVGKLIAGWRHRQQMRPRLIDYELEEASERFRVSRSAVGNRLVGLGLLERTSRGYALLGRPASPPPPPPQPPSTTPPDDDQSRRKVAN